MTSELADKQHFADLISQFKKEFAEILMKVVEEERKYTVVFKAIIDKSGKITIPFAEREVEGLLPNTIVQVKLMAVGKPHKTTLE